MYNIQRTPTSNAVNPYMIPKLNLSKPSVDVLCPQCSTVYSLNCCIIERGAPVGIRSAHTGF